MISERNHHPRRGLSKHFYAYDVGKATMTLLYLFLLFFPGIFSMRSLKLLSFFTFGFIVRAGGL